MRLLFQAHQCPGNSATFSNPGKKNCGRFGRALFFWGFMFGFKLGAVQHALTLRVSFPLCLGHVVNRTTRWPFCS